MITEHKNIKKFSLLLYIIGIVITIAASYCLKSDRLFIILLCCIEMGTTIYFIKRKDKNYLCTVVYRGKYRNSYERIRIICL